MLKLGFKYKQKTQKSVGRPFSAKSVINYENPSNETSCNLLLNQTVQNHTCHTSRSHFKKLDLKLTCLTFLSAPLETAQRHEEWRRMSY